MNENMPTHLKFLQCLLPKSDRRLIVTGFERTHLPRTQQEDTLFTITR